MDSVSFDSIAAVYDETRTFDKHCFNAALDYIAERFPPAKYKRLFEPGIGTGRIAIPLAEKGYRVTGVDISGKMLKRLAEKLSRRRLPLAVAFQQADVIALPFPDATFDIVVAVHVFHLIRNWKKAMSEVFRVLQPDAPLILMFTGSGSEVPHVKDRYRAICAECGHPIRHIGMQREDLPDYVSTIGRHIEQISGRWQWQQRVRVDKTLADIGKRFYSISRHAPDDVHLKAIKKLELELKQQYGDLAVEVEVPTQINLAFVLADR